jgi:hypothetical protein
VPILNFNKDGKSETPLIGAASLGAEEVGLKLLDAGARPEVCDLFGETALHWAALLGEDRLVVRLIPGSDLNLRDEKYNSPPLGWAIHGWSDPPTGNHGRQWEVVALLVAAGARVEPEWLEQGKVRADPTMLASVRDTGDIKERSSRCEDESTEENETMDRQMENGAVERTWGSGHSSVKFRIRNNAALWPLPGVGCEALGSRNRRTRNSVS